MSVEREETKTARKTSLGELEAKLDLAGQDLNR